jgi:uridine kinase
MIGDKLLITDYHREAGKMVFNRIEPLIQNAGKAFLVTVAGESGCGKSKTAFVLSEHCEKAGHKTVILAQDDYFKLPPHSNAKKREVDISWVGMGEVNLDLLDEHMELIRSGEMAKLVKPCAVFKDDTFIDEEIDIENVKVAIAEGTYTTSLKKVDFRAFINRVYTQTKKARIARGRDKMSEFVERVLEIEHQIIKKHKELAQVVIPPPEEERE